MKTTATILAALAIGVGSLKAELTQKQFVQLTDWATNRGYYYEEIAASNGANYYIFTNRMAPGAGYVFALVPISSDTADEAINALLARSQPIGKYLKSVGKFLLNLTKRVLRRIRKSLWKLDNKPLLKLLPMD